MKKTKEEIFEQPYMTAQDLKMLIPTLGHGSCIKYIKMIQKEMHEKGYFVPESKPYLALTKLVREKFGI